MSIQDNKKLPDYIQRCGNIYSAVNCLANDARALTARYNGRITDTQAISWLLSGEKPYMTPCKNYHQEKAARVSLKEAVCYIDDERVKYAVWCSVQRAENSVTLYMNTKMY